MSRARYLLLLLSACLIIFNLRDARACSVPVFRYALERWHPDVYKGVYLFRGVIPEKDRALLQQLQDASLKSDYPLNLKIYPVDVATFPREKLKDLLKAPPREKLPVLKIWYPEQMGKRAPLWTMELTRSNVSALIDSPRRKELAEMLISGASIVWIFVPSGNPQKDDPAMATIRRELDLALEALARMNFFTTAGMKERKLTFEFPILTLSRTDNKERFFLDMLMQSETDLREYTNEPMVFPIFGRGRALGCLFGEYISADKIQDAVSFLAASCSCEVKALNPGVDLMLAAQWDRVLMGELYADEDSSLPELTGVMPAQPSPAKTDAAAGPPESPANSNILKSSGIAFGSALIVVVFATLVVNCLHKKNR